MLVATGPIQFDFYDPVKLDRFSQANGDLAQSLSLIVSAPQKSFSTKWPLKNLEHNYCGKCAPWDAFKLTKNGDMTKSSNQIST
jgi:hypothetical protein